MCRRGIFRRSRICRRNHGALAAIVARLADRIGKGLRTSPRDGLIVDSTPRLNTERCDQRVAIGFQVNGAVHCDVGPTQMLISRSNFSFSLWLGASSKLETRFRSFPTSEGNSHVTCTLSQRTDRTVEVRLQKGS